MALRRDFKGRGAKNLLITLWPISDEGSVQFMFDSYDAAQTENAAQTLAEVQRDWLAKLREERGLQAAVQLAGAFIVSSQGRP